MSTETFPPRLSELRPHAPAPPARLRRILCTIDFSEASVAAVAEAVALAHTCRGEITLLFVIPYVAPSRVQGQELPSGVSAAVTEDVEALLEPARAAGIPVRVCLKAGRPAHEILETARRTTPDVIVMGTHGRGGLKRWALGSVTDEVLRNAPCPVLAIRHRPSSEAPLTASAPSNTVVCGVSLSLSSPRTVAYASEVARATGARLVLLHVIDHRATIDVRRSSGRLHALAAAAGLSADRVEEVVVRGDPARQILRTAASRGVRLVVVGGENGSPGPRIDSTLERVIRGARCAVLTVRATPEGA